MTKETRSTIASATMAVLLATLALAAIVPAPAGAVAVDGGLDIAISRSPGGAITLSNPPTAANAVWLNSTSPVTFTVTLTRPADEDPFVDHVFFGSSVPTDTGAENFTYSAGSSNAEAGWDAGAITDDDSDLVADGFEWSGPSPPTECTLLQTNCPDLTGTGATFTVTLTPSGSDFAAIPFKAVADGLGTSSPTDDYASSNNATFLLGLDRVGPTVTNLALSGHGALPDSRFHSESTLTVTFDVQDTLSGIAALPTSTLGTVSCPGFAVATTSVVSCSVSVTNASEGTTSFTVSATDMAGNSLPPSSQTLKADRTAPATSVSVAAPNGAGWYTLAPSITLTADDLPGNPDGTANAGANGTEYCFGSGCTLGAYSGPVSPPSEGTNTLRYRSVDAAHTANNGTIQSQNFQVDTIAPTASVDVTGHGADNYVNLAEFDLLSAGTGSPGNVFPATYTATDASPGSSFASASMDVERGGVAVAGSPFTGLTNGTGLSFTGLEIVSGGSNDGAYNFTLTVTDVATLSSSSFDDTITVDTVQATAELSLGAAAGDGNDDGYLSAAELSANGGNLKVIYTASDATSGVFTSTIDLDLDGPVSVTPGTALTFSSAVLSDGSDDGNHTFDLSVTDTAGNAASTDSASIILDTQVPNSTVAIAPTLVAASNATIPIECTASDATSGVASVLLQVSFEAGPFSDAGTPFDCAGGVDTNFTATATGTYAFRTVATDVAGNEGLPSGTETVEADLEAPNGTVALDVTQMDVTNDGTFDLDLSHTDVGAGVGSVQLYVDVPGLPVSFAATGSAQSGAGPFDVVYTAVDGDGIYTFRAVATDLLGNVESDSGLFDITVTLDTLAPSLTIDALATQPATNYFAANPTVNGTTDGTGLNYTVDGGSAVNVTIGGLGAWSFSPAPPLSNNTVHNVTVTALDAAGNDIALSRNLYVDTIAPSEGTFSPASGLSVRGLGTVTLPFSDAGSGFDEAATNATLTVTRGVTTLTQGVDYTVDDSVADELSVTFLSDPDGLYTITVTATDAVGNAASASTWTATVNSALDMVSFTNSGITGSATPFALTVGSDTPTVTGSVTMSGGTLTLLTLTDGNCGNGATTTPADGSSISFAGGLWSQPLAGLALDNSPANGDCRYDLTVRATDAFGNAQDEVLQITRKDLRIIEVRVNSVSDPFTAVGQSVVLQYLAKDNTTGCAWASCPVAANLKIQPYRDGVALGTPILTNSLGLASKTVSSPAGAAADLLEGVPTHILTGGSFVEVVDSSSDLADVELTWTRLLFNGALAFEDGQSVTGRGDALTLDMPLMWDHDGSNATGLAGFPNTIGWTLAGTGDGASTDPLVHTPATSTMITGGLVEDGTSGVYQRAYTHVDGSLAPAIEEVTFTPTGGVTSYVNPDVPDDVASSFSVPTTGSLTGNWIGARAGNLTLDNRGEDGSASVTDATDGFVNEDDIVRITVPVTYTLNHEPLAAADDDVADPAANATVSFFVTGSLVAGVPTPIDPAGNGDAFATVRDGDACDRNATAGTVAIDVSRDNTPDVSCVFEFAGVPNAYEITALPTLLEPEGFLVVQNVSHDGGLGEEDDEGDFGALAEITLTGVDVAYVDDSLAGAEDTTDGAGATVDDAASTRWWMSADADEAPSFDDNITFDVQATFTHDGSNATSALVGAFRGSDGVHLGNATADLVSGIAHFEVDPDSLDWSPDTSPLSIESLDYVVRDLDFRVLSAPEPGTDGSLGRAIDYFDAAGTFSQEVLWTKVHVDLAQGLDPDNEANVGAEFAATLTAYYYHDADGDGTGFQANGTLDPDDAAASAGAMNFTLVDTVPAGDDLLALNSTGATLGLGVSFEDLSVARGCDPVSAVPSGCDDPGNVTPEQAGFHTFHGVAGNAPHGLASDYAVDGASDTDGDVDGLTLLWTAAVLDATTDRLTEEAGAGHNVTLEVQAYYAHDHAANGTALALADRVLPYNVTIDVDGTGSAVDEVAVPAGGVYSQALNRLTAGNLTVSALSDDQGTCGGGGDVEDPSLLCVNTVVASQELERRWYALTTLPGWHEAGDGACTTGIDYNGDGDCTDDLFVSDAVSLRNETVEVRTVLALTDGAGGDADTNVTDGYGGLAFATTDVHSLSNMPDRAHATVARAVGADPSNATDQDILEVTGDEDPLNPFGANDPTLLDRAPGAAEFAYNGTCACWTGLIPGHGFLEEDVLYDIASTVALTSDDRTVNAVGDGAPVTTTTVQDSDDDAFATTHTAVVLSFVGSVNEDGEGEVPATSGDELWLNSATNNTWTLRALWAHDANGNGTSYIGTGGTPDGDDVVDGATLEEFDASDPSCSVAFAALGGGLYAGNLTTNGDETTCQYGFRVSLVDDPSSGDPAQVFNATVNPLLNLAALAQTAYHTQIVYTWVSSGDFALNVNDAVSLDFAATWDHDDAPIHETDDGPTLWSYAVPNNAYTAGALGQGTATLLSTTSQVLNFTVSVPALVDNATLLDTPHGITQYVVSSGPAPNVTWTQVLVGEMGDNSTTSAADKLAMGCGGLDVGVYDPPGGATTDCDVYEAGAVVVQGANFTFEHSGDAVPAGSTVTIGGQTKSTGDNAATGFPETSFASANFRALVDSWFLIEGRGVSATFGGSAITATEPASNTIGFDLGSNGIS